MKHGILSAFLFSTAIATAAPLQVNDLRVELQSNPVGIEKLPSLSWKLVSDERGARQSAYQILAATTAEKLIKEASSDVWNSGKKKGTRTHLVPWVGKGLAEGQKVFWKVKVWNSKGEESDWSHPAHFISGGKKVFTRPKRISGFESSSNELNTLFEESLTRLENRLTQFSEGGSRDLGTGAEVQRSARAMLYHFDSLPHLTEWIRLMDESLTKENFFSVQPGSKEVGSVSSDAGIIVNHPVWWMGGDSKLVANRWENFEKYMMAREALDKKFKGTKWGTIPRSEGVPAEYLDLCSLGFTTRLTRELARPAQQPLNALRFEDYAARIRVSFGNQYLQDDGSLKVKSQTAHLLALRCGVLTPEQQKPVITSLITSLKKEGPKVGPIGAHFLPPVLTLTKNQDLAVKTLIALDEEQRKTFAGNGVSEWMMSYLAGIDAASHGFGQALIVPRIPSDGSVNWVKAFHVTPRGKLAVEWKIQADQSLKIDVTIPPGVFARIILPAKAGQDITEGGYSVKEAPGVELAAKTGSMISMIGQPGTYSFLIK